MPYYVYILQSETTGKTYVGQTDNLQRRVEQHNDPDFTMTLYTKRNKGPWKLIHSEAHDTRTGAMRREKQLKSGQGREWIRDTLLSKNQGGC
ncbi:MAG: GIY-YIG nuclease family protein [Candidatus Hydrogenedentota bacterium]